MKIVLRPVIKGGMPTGPDSRIRTTYNHNPSTLRLASQHPNLQNLPRPTSDPNDPANIVRGLITAGPGQILLARDFSGIEALLVGYFAMSDRYMRLCKIDVHSYYTAWALNALDGRISANDLPELSWDDSRLRTRLAEIKKEFKADRNTLYKHLVHGANFFQGAKGAAEKIFHETGIEYPVKLVQKVMDVYFELFPEIRKWQMQLMVQADRDGHLRNPYGYIHRFSKIWDFEKVGGEWQRSPGPESNKVVAFLPQSTAAGIMKSAMLRLYDRFEEAGQYLRLTVHDELLCECPVDYVDTLDAIMQHEMEQPAIELPLRGGGYLSVGTEAKRGERWGQME